MKAVSDPRAHVTPEADRVPLREKLAYGVGGIPNQWGASAIQDLAVPFFNLILGMSPAWIGGIMMISKLWDAFTDPFMGHLSDNTRSRWGRRLPYIAGGSLLCGAFYPLIWLVPTGGGDQAAMLWFAGFSILFFTGFTIAGVPYQTLGYELTRDYHERTRIMAVRSYSGYAANIVLGWVFWIANSKLFDSPIVGMRVTALVLGVLFVVFGVAPALFCRERFYRRASGQEKLSFGRALRFTWRNRPYRILMAMTVLTIVGAFFANGVDIHLNSYHVYGGDVGRGAWLYSVVRTVQLVATALVAIPLLTWLSSRHGKLPVLKGSLLLGAAGYLSGWVFYRPEAPYLVLIPALLKGPCTAAFWLFVNSMKADVCDWDEMQTGMRREGMYGATSMWLQKLGWSATYALGGVVIALSGFDVAAPGQAPESMFWLRFFAFNLPAVVLIGAVLLLRAYPLTEERMYEIRAELDRRNRSRES